MTFLARSIRDSSCLLRKKLNYNTYVIHLEGFKISRTFNIDDLVDYKGPDVNSGDPLVDEPSLELFSENPSLPPLSEIHPNIVEKIDKILNNEIISNRVGGTRRYLIRWKKILVGNTWLDRSDLQQIDQICWRVMRTFLHLT